MVAIFKLIIILIKAIFNKKSEYTISFYKEEGRWYADIPGWPKRFHKNTEMIFGANRFLDYMSKGNDRVTLQVYPTNKDKYPKYGAVAILVKEQGSLLNGAVYKPHCGGEFTESIWICPVTLFVLGYYPKKLFIFEKN